MNIPWLRFEWNLEKLPTGLGQPEQLFQLRPAQKSEEDIVHKVAISAFSMDTGWGDVARLLANSLRENISRSFAKDGANCLVLQHGTRVIGISALNISEEGENHLVTGPCVLHEYRSRGFGRLLLEASLMALKEAGLARAYGIARANTTAARFVYPRFGSLSIPWQPNLEISPKLAA